MFTVAVFAAGMWIIAVTAVKSAAVALGLVAVGYVLYTVDSYRRYLAR